MAADGCYGLTPKQAFTCAYVETGNASEAYRRAYNASSMKDETIWRKAKECLDNGKVTARVEVLRAEHAQRHQITVDSITEMLKEDREKAHAAGQIGAAVSAPMGLAKLHGLIVDKQEQRRIAADSDLASIPTDELETIVRAGLAGAAAAAKGPTEPGSVH